MKKLAYFSMAAVFLFSVMAAANSLARDQEGGAWNHKVCSYKNNSVPNPTVIGPIRAKDLPGHPSHDYPFSSSVVDLTCPGYIEEEFFIEGTANRYTTPTLKTGSIIDGGHHYKTRIVVRRPMYRDQFNGVVLLEWQNPATGADLDAIWGTQWRHILRSGYAWVGVTVHQVNIHGPNGLKLVESNPLWILGCDR